MLKSRNIPIRGLFVLLLVAGTYVSADSSTDPSDILRKAFKRPATPSYVHQTAPQHPAKEPPAQLHPYLAAARDYCYSVGASYLTGVGFSYLFGAQVDHKKHLTHAAVYSLPIYGWIARWVPFARGNSSMANIGNIARRLCISQAHLNITAMLLGIRTTQLRMFAASTIALALDELDCDDYLTRQLVSTVAMEALSL